MARHQPVNAEEPATFGFGEIDETIRTVWTQTLLDQKSLGTIICAAMDRQAAKKTPFSGNILKNTLMFTFYNLRPKIEILSANQNPRIDVSKWP